MGYMLSLFSSWTEREVDLQFPVTRLYIRLAVLFTFLLYIYLVGVHTSLIISMKLDELGIAKKVTI